MILLALVLLVGSGAFNCSHKLPTDTSRGNAMNIELRFPSSGGTLRLHNPTAKTQFSAYDSVRVSVFAEPGHPADTAATPLVRSSLVLRQTGQQYAFQLEVPPSPRYRLTAEVYGIRDRSDLQNFTRPGLQFIGSAIIDPATGGMHAVIPMVDAVPLASAFTNAPFADSVTWDRVPGAIAYTVYNDCEGLCSPILVLAPRTHATTGFFSSEYFVLARFSSGLQSAVSERLVAAEAPAAIDSLVPDFLDAGSLAGAFSFTLHVRGRGFNSLSTITGFNAPQDSFLLQSSVVMDDSQNLRVNLSGSNTFFDHTDSIRVLQPSGQISNAKPFHFVTAR